MRLAPDRLETSRLGDLGPSRRVAKQVGLRPGRRVLFHDLEHIVYGMEAADVGAA